MNKKYEIIDRILEYEIYLYMIFMFLTKGEGVRNLLLFSGFFLWLATFRHRENRWILKKPVPLLFWGFIAAIISSVIFSIDPYYSFSSLRGDPLKAVIIFCLFSTVLSDEKRLRRFIHLSWYILVFTISAGYYSYFAYDLPLMKPVTYLRHAWHARFAVDLCTVIPFTFILLLITKDRRLKTVLFLSIIAGISGIILSTSRGGLAGFIAIAIIFLIYFIKNKRLDLKITAAALIMVTLIFTISLTLSPLLKHKLFYDKNGLTSFNERTEIWSPLVAAAFQRPVFGWGYGSDLFASDTPFENTPYKVAPVNRKAAFRNPHNPFLRILFHQGMVGLVSYILLLVFAARAFWKGAGNAGSFRGHVLIACTAILTGIHFINAIVENLHLRDLSFILSIGLAALYMKSENSHT